MTDKTKIVLIYAGVAVICALIVTVAVLLSALKGKKGASDEMVTGVGKEEVPVMQTLEADIKLTRQDGEKVSLFELKDKVWVAAQFYASCPMCAARNSEQLLGIYKEFADDPDFRMVCFSIDPEVDTLEHLNALEEALQVDGGKWWFLKGEGEGYMKYLEDQMGWLSVRKQSDPLLAEAKGKWVHDMSLEVYDGLDLVAKVTVDGNDAVAESNRERLKMAVSKALAKR